MTIEIKVPPLPESVSDATVAKWYKQVGDTVTQDENLLDLETDKVMLEVPSPSSGVIESFLVEEGAIVTAGQVIATVREGAVDAGSVKESTAEAAEVPQSSSQGEADLTPAVRRLIAEKGVDVSKVSGTGKNGRITKLDIEKFLSNQSRPVAVETVVPQAAGKRYEERVPMSRLRLKVAERLLAAQSDTAMLTSFNEVNMQSVMDLRKKYKGMFEKEFDTRLGFMSFFVKAAVEALKRFPAVNASIDGSDIVYHNYFDISIAVGSPRGLVVPVVRDADQLNMADVEKKIRDFGARAQTGKITIDEMTGGTFTISNGGTYGSMLSTPIINPPQSAILGMHNIVERPVVEAGNIVVRPIMYLALTYDHRIIDGRDSVLFLRTIKELLEDPARILLSI